MFEVLTDLVAKSLVTLIDTGGQVRYRLLETVREYAAQCLAERGGAAAASDRQLQWAVALAERAEDGLWGHEAPRWTEALDAEVDNLRVALRWGQGSGRVGLGLRLAAAMAYFWNRHGYSAEGRRWLGELLAAKGPEQGPARARCLAAAAGAAFSQGDDPEALSLGAEAVALARQSGDKRALGWALRELGRFQVPSGHLLEARGNLDEARALGEESEDRRLVEGAMSTLARLEINYGSMALGRRYAEECIASCRASGNVRTLAYALSGVAEAEFHTGNFGRAVGLLEEPSGNRQLGDVLSATNEQVNLGACLLAQASSVPPSLT